MTASAANLDELSVLHPDIPEVCFQAARRLLEAVPCKPDTIDRGYNPTICIYWSYGRAEVEVDSSDFVLYSEAVPYGIAHFPHGGDDFALPIELLAFLPRSSPVRAAAAWLARKVRARM